MTEKQSFLQIDFASVTDCLNQPDEELYSREYLRGVQQHMRRYQPEVEKMITREHKPDPVMNKYFRAGAISTYDLIVTSDPEHWEQKSVSKDTIQTVKRNFVDSVITNSKGGMLLDRNRVVTDMEWFYDKLTTDSPTFAEWIQLRVDAIGDGKSAREFIYGSLLTAMPFYLTRESEVFSRLFSF